MGPLVSKVTLNDMGKDIFQAEIPNYIPQITEGCNFYPCYVSRHGNNVVSIQYT